MVSAPEPRISTVARTSGVCGEMGRRRISSGVGAVQERSMKSGRVEHWNTGAAGKVYGNNVGAMT